jgi:hypothetical protein
MVAQQPAPGQAAGEQGERGSRAQQRGQGRCQAGGRTGGPLGSDRASTQAGLTGEGQLAEPQREARRGCGAQRAVHQAAQHHRRDHALGDQQRPQLGHSGGQAPADRRLRDAELLRKLELAARFEVVPDQHLARLVRQLLQRLVEQRADAGPARCVVLDQRLRLGPPRLSHLAPHQVDGGMMGDPMQPAGERLGDRAGMAQQAQEGLLGSVLRQAAVVEHSAADAVDHAGMATHQLGEGVAIAVLGETCQQHLIGGRHASSALSLICRHRAAVYAQII